MWGIILLACSLPIVRALHVSGVASDEKVTVRVYGEAGCRFTREYLTGPVKAALKDADTAQAMDFEFSPFGNAYFIIESCRNAAEPGEPTGPGCGGGGGYSSGMRACFNKLCGLGVANRSEACFSGPLLCQHGFKECAFDRYFACAKAITKQAGNGSAAYMPFVLCMVDGYSDTPGGDPFMSLVGDCAGSAGVPFEALRACYGGPEGSAALAAEAANTPDHPGVPFVTVNGYAMEETYEPKALLKAVKSVRRGEAPPSGALAAAQGAAANLWQLAAQQRERETPPCDNTDTQAQWG